MFQNLERKPKDAARNQHHNFLFKPTALLKTISRMKIERKLPYAQTHIKDKQITTLCLNNVFGSPSGLRMTSVVC